VAKIAAANSRPMTDQAFMTAFPSYGERVLPNINATATLNVG
jgi:hypothetical protein